MTDPITITAAADLTELAGPIHDPNDLGVKKGRVLIEMDASGSLTMRDDPNAPQGWNDKFVYEYNNETFLAIRANSIVELVLAGQTKWSFNVQNGLLKFKDAHHEQWYKVRYSPSQKPVKNILLHATPSGQAQNTEGARHSFNLMINLNQKLSDGTDGRPLPVIIDPDAKNPPPNGSTFIPSNNPVPILSFGA